MDLKPNKYSFEQFIIQCCKSGELELRNFIKKMLKRNNFTILEDDYESDRGGKFAGIHNLLAVRGDQQKVCLVAHTDVCRDHSYRGANRIPVKPVVKLADIRGEVKRIIQTEDCDVQVGGDDRLGVAINLWTALNTGYDMGLLFTTDEEVGCISASNINFPELMDFELLCQTDRGRHRNQLVTRIGGVKLCDDRVTEKLLAVAEKIGLPRYEVDGFLTDVYTIKRAHKCRDACNLTVGYYNAECNDEYIDIQEAQETVTYVSSIIQRYELDEILDNKKGFGNTNKVVQDLVASSN